MRVHADGCAAVNAGKLNAAVERDIHGVEVGSGGSAPVGGFGGGDVLAIAVEAEAGSSALTYSATLAIMDQSPSGRLMAAFTLPENALEPHSALRTVASFTVGPLTSDQSIFASSRLVGAGKLSIQVRCEPAGISRIPVS
jgi:hypothetical protein